MIEPPDLAKFGRSEQLHAALFGINNFVAENNRYPNESDYDKVLELSNNQIKENLKADEANL